MSSLSLLLFVIVNFSRVLRKLYFLDSYKFLARALSSVQNAMLRYQCNSHCIKNYYSQQYHPFLFKSTTNVL